MASGWEIKRKDDVENFVLNQLRVAGREIAPVTAFINARNVTMGIHVIH